MIIQLTFRLFLFFKKKGYVNNGSIACMKPYLRGTKLYLAGGKTVCVVETPNIIINALIEAEKMARGDVNKAQEEK